MTDWADELVTKLLDNSPELKQVSLREIMAMALRDVAAARDAREGEARVKAMQADPGYQDMMKRRMSGE